MLSILLRCIGLGVICSAFAACSGPREPVVPGVYRGSPVTFPVNFRGAGVQQILLKKRSRLNIPVACNYKMGNQTGKFKTPAAVPLKFTKQKQILELDCKVSYVDRGGLFDKTFKGEIKDSVETNFTGYYNVEFLNWRNPEVIVPVGGGAFLRNKLISEQGVQLLPAVIVVDPNIERVWKNGSKTEGN